MMLYRKRVVESKLQWKGELRDLVKYVKMCKKCFDGWFVLKNVGRLSSVIVIRAKGQGHDYLQAGLGVSASKSKLAKGHVVTVLR